jgi:hypothetical protein
VPDHVPLIDDRDHWRKRKDLGTCRIGIRVFIGKSHQNSPIVTDVSATMRKLSEPTKSFQKSTAETADSSVREGRGIPPYSHQAGAGTHSPTIGPPRVRPAGLVIRKPMLLATLISMSTPRQAQPRYHCSGPFCAKLIINERYETRSRRVGPRVRSHKTRGCEPSDSWLNQLVQKCLAL